MRKTLLIVGLVFAPGLFGPACGGGSSPSTKTECVPGSTTTCVGPGACRGGQVCLSDGSGYGACNCGGDSGATGAGGGDGSSGDAAMTDSADVPEEAPVGQLSPGKLPGLSLWLDSDKGVTLCSGGSKPSGLTVVEFWVDQSSNANTAKGLGCPTAPTSSPGLIKADIKGHDAIAMGGYDHWRLHIKDDPTLRFGTGPFCFISVMTTPFDARPSLIFSKQSITSPAESLEITSDVKLNVKTPSADARAAKPMSGYHVFVVRGPSLEIRIDGVATKGKDSTDDIGYPGGDIFMGGGDKAWNLAELIVVKGAVSDAQVAGVESYLKAKYKFTW